MVQQQPASASSGNNNRIGLTLIAVVLCLYTFGLMTTVWNLPSPNHRKRAWLRKLTGGGGNINLSKNGLAEGSGDDDDDEGSGDDEEEDESADPIPRAK